MWSGAAGCVGLCESEPVTCADVRFAQRSVSSFGAVAMLMPGQTQVGDMVDIGFDTKRHVQACFNAVRLQPWLYF